MSKVIFDVETVGEDFSALDETSQEYFLKFAKSEEEKEEAKNSLSFFPLTAQIITIGMLDADSEKGWVFFQPAAGQKLKNFSEGEIEFILGDERAVLEGFWQQMKKFTTFITFNGRVFDCPFIMLRSAILGIKPGKNLMPYRYGHTVHVDLQDQLTFYDAMRRKFSLHMWCRAFNIKSPKEAGITGLEVKDYYKAGRAVEIAKYCAGDLLATKGLYHYWEKYLKF
ncbi:MAG: ribonuclease H-like domain-containing protein [Candidatus Omnitrophota bacterium]